MLMKRNKITPFQQFYQTSKKFISEDLFNDEFNTKFSIWQNQFPLDINSDLIIFETKLNKKIQTFDFSFLTVYSSVKKFIPETASEKLELLINRTSYTYPPSSEALAALEFDTSDELDAPPNVFLQREPFLEMNPTVLSKFVFDLFDSKLNPSQFAINIAKFLSATKQLNGEIGCIGLMFPRKIPGIKIPADFKDNFTKNIELMFSKLGLESRFEEVNVIVSKIQQFLTLLKIVFDIGNEISDRICINCVSTQWENIFDVLLSHNLILPEKAKACLDWVGQHSVFDVDGTYTKFNRTIRNLKFVFSPNAPLEIKIYLEVIIQAQQQPFLFNLEAPSFINKEFASPNLKSVDSEL